MRAPKGRRVPRQDAGGGREAPRLCVTRDKSVGGWADRLGPRPHNRCGASPHATPCPTSDKPLMLRVMAVNAERYIRSVYRMSGQPARREAGCGVRVGASGAPPAPLVRTRSDASTRGGEGRSPEYRKRHCRHTAQAGADEGASKDVRTDTGTTRPRRRSAGEQTARPPRQGTEQRTGGAGG